MVTRMYNDACIISRMYNYNMREQARVVYALHKYHEKRKLTKKVSVIKAVSYTHLTLPTILLV